MEIQYSLMTFGIPTHALPLNMDGTLDVARSCQQIYAGEPQPTYKPSGTSAAAMVTIQEEEAKDDDSTTTTMIVQFPRPNDVLCGRGGPYQSYGGNLRLTKIADAYREKYQRAERFEKMCIAADVVKLVQASGVRFLKRTPPLGWTVVADTEAREKVGNNLRRPREYFLSPANGGTHKKKKSQKQQQQQQKQPQNTFSLPNPFWGGPKRRKFDEDSTTSGGSMGSQGHDFY